jgi:hypothetical protein
MRGTTVKRSLSVLRSPLFVSACSDNEQRRRAGRGGSQPPRSASANIVAIKILVDSS